MLKQSTICVARVTYTCRNSICLLIMLAVRSTQTILCVHLEGIWLSVVLAVGKR